MQRDDDYAEVICYCLQHRCRSTREAIWEAFEILGKRRGVLPSTVRANCIRHQGFKGPGATDAFIRQIDRAIGAVKEPLSS